MPMALDVHLLCYHEPLPRHVPPQNFDAWLLETCTVVPHSDSDPPCPIPSPHQSFDDWLLETCTVVPGEDRWKRLEAWAQAPGGKLVGALEGGVADSNC